MSQTFFQIQIKCNCVVLVVVGDATVVVVQHGLVGKIVIRSMTNMVGWVLLHSYSHSVPGLPKTGHH